MIYNARVISKSSKIFTKKVDADNIENAKESLLKSGLKPVEINPDWVATILTKFTKRRLSRKEHIAFFEDFISFIKIGLSTEEILNQIEDTSLSKNVKNVSQKMVDMIHKGYHLSQAMDETGMFSDLAVKTIKLGEVSPSIEPVMNDLVAHYRKEDTFYSGMRTVMVYPAILVVVLVSVFFFLCFWVLPEIQSAFAFTYPLGIRILIKLAELSKEYWYIILTFFIVGVVVFKQVRNKKFGEAIYRFIYAVPVIGSISKKFIFVSIFGNLSILQKSGMTLRNSINYVAETMPYKHIVKKLKDVGSLLGKGFNFSDAISGDKFFPRLIPVTIKKGQMVGQLQESFQKISDYYSEKLQKDIERTLAIAPKVILTLAGVFLLLIALGTLGPAYLKGSQVFTSYY